MKKFLAVFFLAFSLFQISDIYPLTTIVVATIPENDIVILEDFNENQWEFSGIEDWETGDICSCIMNKCGTETIYDDEIISIKYDGYFS